MTMQLFDWRRVRGHGLVNAAGDQHRHRLTGAVCADAPIDGRLMGAELMGAVHPSEKMEHLILKFF